MESQKKSENKLVTEFKREDLDISAFSDEDIEFYNKILKPKTEDVESYGVRKSKEEKENFIKALKERYKDKDEIEIRTYKNWKCFWETNNIVIGDLNNCDFILTAHYDTPPKGGENISVRDFLEKYKKPVKGKGFQMHQVKAGFIKRFICIELQYSYFFSVLSFLLIVLFFKFQYFQLQILIALGIIITIIPVLKLKLMNKPCNYCFNDNSLGIIMALQLYKEFNYKSAVILFDNEENGLIGSSLMKKEVNGLNKPVINFDTICLGNSLVFNYSKDFNEKTFNSNEIIEYLKNKDEWEEAGIKINYEVNQDHINFSNYLWISYATIVKVHNHIFIKKGPIHTNNDNLFLIDRFNDYRVKLINVLSKIKTK